MEIGFYCKKNKLFHYEYDNDDYENIRCRHCGCSFNKKSGFPNHNKVK